MQPKRQLAVRRMLIRCCRYFCASYRFMPIGTAVMRMQRISIFVCRWRSSAKRRRSLSGTFLPPESKLTKTSEIVHELQTRRASACTIRHASRQQNSGAAVSALKQWITTFRQFITSGPHILIRLDASLRRQGMGNGVSFFAWPPISRQSHKRQPNSRDRREPS